MDVVRTSVQGWLSPAPGSLGRGPIVARLPCFGQVPPSTLPDFFLAQLMPRLPARPPWRIPLLTPAHLSSLISRADCRCRDGAVSPASAPPQGWPCAARGPTQPGSRESPAAHGGGVPMRPGLVRSGHTALPSASSIHRRALHINGLNIRPQV